MRFELSRGRACGKPPGYIWVLLVNTYAGAFLWILWWVSILVVIPLPQLPIPGEDAEKIVSKHIKLLHRYNEAKDATQVKTSKFIKLQSQCWFCFLALQVLIGRVRRNIPFDLIITNWRHWFSLQPWSKRPFDKYIWILIFLWKTEKATSLLFAQSN